MSDISHGMGAGTSGEDARRADLERKASSLAERARTRLGATVEPIAERAREFRGGKKQSGAERPGGAAAIRARELLGRARRRGTGQRRKLSSD
jgi:hypothetical protein